MTSCIPLIRMRIRSRTANLDRTGSDPDLCWQKRKQVQGKMHHSRRQQKWPCGSTTTTVGSDTLLPYALVPLMETFHLSVQCSLHIVLVYLSLIHAVDLTATYRLISDNIHPPGLHPDVKRRHVGLRGRPLPIISRSLAATACRGLT
jgi:hypothetical protein